MYTIYIVTGMKSRLFLLKFVDLVLFSTRKVTAVGQQMLRFQF